jgi:transposase-like protein
VKADRFGRWLSELVELTAGQREKLTRALCAEGDASQVVTMLEERGVSRCPHCHAGHPVRYGKASGLQRYRCHACTRTFNVLTGTPLAGLHKPGRWAAFAQALREGLSVRKAADRCGVHYNTTHRWRHRFLALPAAMQAQALSGIAEADETFFRHSRKGSRQLSRTARKRGGAAAQRGRGDEQVCVLVARDRAGRTLSQVMPQFDQDTLKTVLKPRLDRDAVLCTDGLPVYRAFAAQSDIAHQPLNLAQGIRVKDKVFHIQNVNAYDSRLKAWMARFNGVSTKYLPNYLGWFRMLDAGGDALSPKHIVNAAMGKPYQQWLVT